MSSMPLLKQVKIRREVLEGTYQSAIDVAEIDRGTAPEFLRDPVEFFKRTAVTPGVKALVVKVLMSLLNVREAVVGGTRYTVTSKLFVLPSLFGGGKSHALATVYHVVKVISSSRSRSEAYERLAVLDRDIAEFIKENWDRLVITKPKIVLVHGQYSDYAPSPFDGKPVKSIWGYIAERLGEYQAMSTYDESFTAPPTEALERVISNKGAVILVDEIAYYYSRIARHGTRTYVDVVNSFIFGLSSLLGSREVPSVAVVLTLPYSREREIVEKAHVGLMDASTIKKILDRTKPDVIVVTKPEDIATIVRRRVFDEPAEKLESLGRAVAKAIIMGVPAEDVRNALLARGFEEALSKTYPVHPETIETLKALHSMLSEHLQLARSPIAMVVEAVKAVSEGCFDWMGFEPHLLMPYHIPVFDEQVIISSLTSSDPELYRFKYILEESVVKIGRGSGKCSPSLQLSNYVSARDYEPPVYAIATYIWLRSLPGRGLIANKDLYPTSDRIVYAILDLPVARDEKWYDVKLTLEQEVKRLPYVNEEDDRWFFKWTPQIRELIARYAKDVTDEEVSRRLRELVESLFRGDEKEKEKEKAEVVQERRNVFTGRMSDMLLIDRMDKISGENATVVVYTRKVDEGELKIPYNNVVVMVPDTSSKIPPEEVKRYEIPPVSTYWEALLAVLRYVVVCEEKLKLDILREIYREEIERDADLLKRLDNDVNKLGKTYNNRARELFVKVYGDIRLRQTQRPIRLTYIQHLKSLFDVIEYTLLNKYVFKSVEEDWILNIGRKLGMDVDGPSGISLNSVWQYLLTGSDEHIPVVSLDWFVRNALKPLEHLDYAVVARNKVYWKKVYSSRSEAVQALQASGKNMDMLPERGRDYEQLIQVVKSLLRNGEEVRLVSYVHVWKQWLEDELGNLQGEVLVMTDGKTERVLDRDLVAKEPTLHLLLKSMAVYREKLKVKIEAEHPGEVEPGSHVKVVVKLSSATIKSARLRVQATGAKPESVEKDVPIPHTEELVFEQAEGARVVRLSITVEDRETGSVLGRHEVAVSVKRPVVELVEEVLTADEARRLQVEELRGLEITRTDDYFRVVPLLRELGGEATVSAVFDKLRLETLGSVSVDEANEVVNAVLRLKECFSLSSFSLKLTVPRDKTNRVDILSKLPSTVRVKAVVRETKGGVG